MKRIVAVKDTYTGRGLDENVQDSKSSYFFRY